MLSPGWPKGLAQVCRPQSETGSDGTGPPTGRSDREPSADRGPQPHQDGRVVGALGQREIREACIQGHPRKKCGSRYRKREPHLSVLRQPRVDVQHRPVSQLHRQCSGPGLSLRGQVGEYGVPGPSRRPQILQPMRQGNLDRPDQRSIWPAGRAICQESHAVGGRHHGGRVELGLHGHDGKRLRTLVHGLHRHLKRGSGLHDLGPRK